jgi:hypothetical protein
MSMCVPRNHPLEWSVEARPEPSAARPSRSPGPRASLPMLSVCISSPGSPAHRRCFRVVHGRDGERGAGTQERVGDGDRTTTAKAFPSRGRSAVGCPPAVPSCLCIALTCSVPRGLFVRVTAALSIPFWRRATWGTARGCPRAPTTCGFSPAGVHRASLRAHLHTTFPVSSRALSMDSWGHISGNAPLRRWPALPIPHLLYFP